MLKHTINPDHMKKCVLKFPLNSRLHFIPQKTVPRIWKGIAHGYPAPRMREHARPAGEDRKHTRSPLLCLHRHQLRMLLLAKALYTKWKKSDSSAVATVWLASTFIERAAWYKIV